VLWSLRTTPNRSTGLTPFFLTYGSEAVLPRVKPFDPATAAAAHEDAMNLLEEARLATLHRSARYQQALRRYHERRIRERTLQVGDMVLHRLFSTKDRHKLSPPWEGPYTIAEVVRPDTFRLMHSNGNILTNTWNIEHLRRFFP